jgi:hypothetical protein
VGRIEAHKHAQLTLSAMQANSLIDAGEGDAAGVVFCRSCHAGYRPPGPGVASAEILHGLRLTSDYTSLPDLQGHAQVPDGRKDTDTS